MPNLIVGLGAALFIINQAVATWVSPIDCVNCTDGVHDDVCTTYGASCCDPCKSTLLPDIPIQSCPAGQYLNQSTCTNCPDGGTSAAGSLAVTACYKDAQWWPFTDATGAGEQGWTSPCYFTED
ncbi:MAG: hypothetical protein K2L95_00695 [Alphaproteobacteria bacterium]|nr:hypothetical protein [Alphaproteobacteria bacterium]